MFIVGLERYFYRTFGLVGSVVAAALLSNCQHKMANNESEMKSSDSDDIKPGSRTAFVGDPASKSDSDNKPESPRILWVLFNAVHPTNPKLTTNMFVVTLKCGLHDEGMRLSLKGAAPKDQPRYIFYSSQRRSNPEGAQPDKHVLLLMKNSGSSHWCSSDNDICVMIHGGGLSVAKYFSATPLSGKITYHSYPEELLRKNQPIDDKLEQICGGKHLTPKELDLFKDMALKAAETDGDLSPSGM